MVLNPFTYTIFQSSSNHQERTDSRRGLNIDETRLKSPLEGERGGGGPSLLCRRSVTRNVDPDKLDLCYCLSRYWGA